MKKYLSIFLYAVLAGICIGLGGTVFLRVRDAFAGGAVVGAMLFTVGLFTICTRGYNLFTGKACYLFDNKPVYILTLAVIWIGNLAGCLILALIERATGICGESGINTVAAGVVEAKMSAGFGSLFLLGVICNILIYIAVNGYAKAPHDLGKYLSLFFGVMVFILSGTEHSIADMYYWSVSGVLFSAPGQSLLRIVVISLGNVAGGVCFPLVEKAYLKLTEKTE